MNPFSQSPDLQPPTLAEGPALGGKALLRLNRHQVNGPLASVILIQWSIIEDIVIAFGVPMMRRKVVLAVLPGPGSDLRSRAVFYGETVVVSSSLPKTSSGFHPFPRQGLQYAAVAGDQERSLGRAKWLQQVGRIGLLARYSASGKN